jgi:hypothetical protein
MTFLRNIMSLSMAVMLAVLLTALLIGASWIIATVPMWPWSGAIIIGIVIIYSGWPE